jgi:hypothetical protein
MANSWFRLYAEFATDPKVQMLSESHQRRLVMVFCMRCNGNVTLHDEEVAFQLRISNEEWADTKAVFMAKGFIDDTNEVLNWDKRQFVSDSSAERVAKHREKKKQACNVTVTPPDTEQIQNRTDTEQIYEPNGSLSSTEADDRPEPVQIKKKKTPIPYQAIVDLYHERMPMCPTVEMLTTKRKGQISARWNSGELPDLKTWADFFEFCAQSPFLTGKTDPAPGRKRFIANLEWITNESNYAKIVEGKYRG